MEKYNIYLMGAISGEDGPKTKQLRAAMGYVVAKLGHNNLSPHVSYDYEQTSFREKIGGLDFIAPANIEFMDQADIFLGEGSGTSEGRGGEVFYGLFARGVPVIYLREQSWGRGTSMIFGNKHPLLYVAMYTPDTLEQTVVDAIAKIPEMKSNFEEWKKKGANFRSLYE